MFFCHYLFFLFYHRHAVFFSVLYILQFCVLAFLRIHYFLEVSSFSHCRHRYFNLLMLKMFLTLLLSFPKAFLRCILPLSSGFTFLADGDNCLQPIHFQPSAVESDPEQKFWGKIGPQLMHLSCAPWRSPAAIPW